MCLAGDNEHSVLERDLHLKCGGFSWGFLMPPSSVGEIGTTSPSRCWFLNCLWLIL